MEAGRKALARRSGYRISDPEQMVVPTSFRPPSTDARSGKAPIHSTIIEAFTAPTRAPEVRRSSFQMLSLTRRGPCDSQCCERPANGARYERAGI